MPAEISTLCRRVVVKAKRLGHFSEVEVVWANGSEMVDHFAANGEVADIDLDAAAEVVSQLLDAFAANGHRY